MELLIFWIICGIVGAVIGSKKDAGGKGFILGLILGPLGIIISIFMKGNRRQCPSCREYISQDAARCPKCQKDLAQLNAPIIIDGEPSIEHETKKCPACAEQIKLEAIKCRFCGHDFDPRVVEFEIQTRKRVLKDRVFGGYVSQQGIQGEAFCFGCRTTGLRSKMLYNEKTDIFYHMECMPKTIDA